jgi:bifunctional non-homologous end joining protein LigD
MIHQRKRRMQNESANSRTKSRTKSVKQRAKPPPKRRSKAGGVPARYIKPMLLQLVTKRPEGEQWLYEVKWDGYRGVAVMQNAEAQLWSGNQRDFGKRFASIVDALAAP